MADPLGTPKPSEAHTRRNTASRVIGTVGEVLVTVAVILALFAVYQLWWTNVAASASERQARSQAESLFAGGAPATWPDGVPPIGEPFALMYIPRLKDRVWGTPVIQGVERPQLAAGIGHYPQTAMPDEPGNFAVAGHRATNGEPFADFERLRDGDKVVVRTSQSWIVYELKRDRIVTPNDVWVIKPQPFHHDPLPSDKIITLTTCHPRWTSTQRWIYWGVQVAATPASGPAPSEVS